MTIQEGMLILCTVAAILLGPALMAAMQQRRKDRQEEADRVTRFYRQVLDWPEPSSPPMQLSLTRMADDITVSYEDLITEAENVAIAEHEKATGERQMRLGPSGQRQVSLRPGETFRPSCEDCEWVEVRAFDGSGVMKYRSETCPKHAPQVMYTPDCEDCGFQKIADFMGYRGRVQRVKPCPKHR